MLWGRRLLQRAARFAVRSKNTSAVDTSDRAEVAPAPLLPEVLEQKDPPLVNMLNTWLYTSILEARLFLEHHPELLEARSRLVLNARIAQPDQSRMVTYALQDRLALLEDIKARTRVQTLEVAVSEGYINNYGGLKGVAVPPWLSQELLHYDHYLKSDLFVSAEDVLITAIERVRLDQDILPETLASLLLELASVFNTDSSIVETDHIEGAISLFHEALETYTPQRYPHQYAQAQLDLANAYHKLHENSVSDRSRLIEVAINCDQEALRFLTLETFPYDYAQVQRNMGNRYLRRIAGERRENVEAAIACFHSSLQVCTIPDFPFSFASAQNDLGVAFLERIAGGRRENLNQAILCFRQARKIFTHTAYPKEHKLAEYNLRNVVIERVGYTLFDSVLNGVRFLSRGNVQFGLRSSDAQQAVYDKTLLQHFTSLAVNTADISPYQAGLQQSLFGEQNQRNDSSQQRLPRVSSDVRSFLRRQTQPQQIQNFYRSVRRVEKGTKDKLQWASLFGEIGIAVFETPYGDHAENVEYAIEIETMILQVFTTQTSAVEWARVQHNLGNAYSERIRGSRSSNLEQAIRSFENALRIRTYDADPEEWAMTQYCLGLTYNDPTFDENEDYQERALACFEHALTVSTPNDFPDWARSHYCLGNIYRHRLAGERSENQERALAAFEAALQMYTSENSPSEWVETHLNIAEVYLTRIRGNHITNMERSLAALKQCLNMFKSEADLSPHVLNSLGHFLSRYSQGDMVESRELGVQAFQAALELTHREVNPVDYALLLIALGQAYCSRIQGDQNENTQLALQCYHEALQYISHTTSPTAWANLQDKLGTLYLDYLSGEKYQNVERAIDYFRATLGVYDRQAFPEEQRNTHLRIARAQATNYHWEEAHLAYAEALETEALLRTLSAGVEGHDAVAKLDGSAAIYDSFVLATLGRLEESLVTLERDRARLFMDAQLLASANLQVIRDLERRERYQQAHHHLVTTQKDMNTASSRTQNTVERRQFVLATTTAFRQAKKTFDAVVQEIREAQDPAHFLSDEVSIETIQSVLQGQQPGFALVYLLATPWGGMALIASLLTEKQGHPVNVHALPLPELTLDFVHHLIETGWDGHKGRVNGGYLHAQQATGLFWMTYAWPGETFAEIASSLHAMCIQTNDESTLDKAAQEILSYPLVQMHANSPLKQLDKGTLGVLEATLEDSFLKLEVQRCLPKLASTVMRPVITWLQEQGIASIALIPCGLLSSFPLLAASLNDFQAPRAWETSSDRLEASIIPNARALSASADTTTGREGVYTVGDPWPTHQQLRWGEAEASTLAMLGGQSERSRVRYDATREWLLHAFGHAYVLDICCHGEMNEDDFLQSHLKLAHHSTITLGEVLSDAVNVHGLRLVILSACQSALPQLSGANNEERSLSASMLQAGAQAVLGTLWPVDDKATYLLIVRFAQEWFPVMETEPPSLALGRAQRWLRSVTNRQLQEWHASQLYAEREEYSSMSEEDGQEQEQNGEGIAREEHLVVVRGRGNRYEAGEAEKLFRVISARRKDPESCPYEDPVYWAGFYLMGR